MQFFFPNEIQKKLAQTSIDINFKEVMILETKQITRKHSLYNNLKNFLKFISTSKYHDKYNEDEARAFHLSFKQQGDMTIDKVKNMSENEVVTYI